MFPLQEYRLLLFTVPTKKEKNDKELMPKEELENKF